MITHVCIGPCGLEKPMSEFTSFKGRLHGYKRCHACRAEMALERADAEAQGRNLKQERLDAAAIDAAIHGIEKQVERLVRIRGKEYIKHMLKLISDDV